MADFTTSCSDKDRNMDEEAVLAEEFLAVSQEYGISTIELEPEVDSDSIIEALHSPSTLLQTDIDGEQGENYTDSQGISLDCPDTLDCIEKERIDEFLRNTCNCKFGSDGKPCSTSFVYQEVMEYRSNCLELSNTELDLVILAQINSQYMSGKKGVSYYYKSRKICRKMLLFFHTISDKRYRNLLHHYEESGVTPRTHGLVGHSPVNTTSLTNTIKALDFIKNLASAVALPIPGRLPNFKDERVVLLPTDMTKMEVYRKYKIACRNEQNQPIGRSTFLNLWNKQLPYISVTKPATDLCWDCQKNLSLILRSSNLSEEEKSNRLENAKSHLDMAKRQREHYNSECVKCSDQWENYMENPITQYDGAMHYSFDYAQQVHYPSDALQPGPLFFKTARKCNVFGICCEPKHEQINYLIDEADYIGKGSNSTVSMLHHFLENHGVHENDLYLQADNCVGQNKNNVVIQYLVWRVLTGRCKKASLSFMLVGHTKFAPDRYFGLFKRKYRHSKVSTLVDVCQAVTASTITGNNKVQLTEQHGRRLVHWYDWTQFFSLHFRHLPGITSYHHFRADTEKPGFIFYKEYANTEESNFSLLKQGSRIRDISGLPSLIEPDGLDPTRQWYLYENIRPFCGSNLAADLTCPKPSIPKPGTSDIIESVNESVQPKRKMPTTPITSTPKHPRTCSHCKESGHFKSKGGKITCPQLIANNS